MTTYRLTYFDVDGGRAEPTRIAFHAAGIAYEDVRISFQEFQDQRQSYRFTCVPVLEIDGQQVTQSTAICRYVGKQCGLYPDDDLQALYCDEALGAVEDTTNHIGRTMRLSGDALREAREQLAGSWLPIMLRGLEEILQRGGGEYFANGQLTIADLAVFVQTRWLQSGFLDHIPTDIVERIAPSLVAHKARVEAAAPVASYYAARAAKA
jgi:glutathione S-transferase